MLVEIPAFLLVAVTGAWMLQSQVADLALQAKIAFGALAVAANALCVWLVFRRRAHARLGDWAAFARVDRLQHQVGTVVLVGVLGALAVGLLR